MGPGDVIALVASIAAVLGVYITYSNNRESTRRLVDDKAIEQDRRITALETKMDVFWAGVAADVAAILHHPHPEYAERDALLERYLSGDITHTEMTRLRDMLREVVGDIHTQAPASGERVAASILLRAIEVEYAAEEGASEGDHQGA